MPKVTEAHAEARRLQIIEAACICFSRKGFHGTTVQDICKTAGLSAGAVYSYFSSKNELIEALVGETKRRNEQLFDRLRTRETVEEIVAELTRSFFDSVDASAKTPDRTFNPYKIKVGLWAESLRKDNFLKGLQDSYRLAITELAEIFRRGQKRGQVAPGLDPVAIAQTFLSLCEGYTLQRAFDDTVDRESYVRAMNGLLAGVVHQGGS